MTMLGTIRKRSALSPAYNPIRVVLVRLDGTAADRAALAAAADVATAMSAHVSAVQVPKLPPTIARLVGKVDDRSGFGPSDDLVSTDLTTSARAGFDVWARERGPLVSSPWETGAASASFRSVDGDEPDILVHEGRLADIIIASGPGLATLEALLLASGRPVLLVPKAWKGSLFANGALVAWNGSAQAARAIGAALPLLRALTRPPAIFTAPERKHTAAPRDAADYLSRHGVSAETISGRDGNAGAQLIEIAAARRDGFIVCGAFAHRALRQALFGGVTTTLIERADIPILFVG